jgi:hypothetical protein
MTSFRLRPKIESRVRARERRNPVITCLPMTLEDARNIATIVGVVVALAVYIKNSFETRRQRRIENAMRFVAAHQRLFDCQFFLDNWHAIEKGTFERDRKNEQAEKNFSRLLSEIEHMALLEKTGAISKTLSIYMFGWWAQRLQPILTAEERNNVYWELVVTYLDDLKSAADDFYKLCRRQRKRYHKAKHFRH